MKKVLALLLTAAMALGLVACGGGSEKEAEALAPEDTKIVVWVSGAGAQVEAMKTACDAFAAETG